MQQLSGLDTMMVLGELPDTPLHISALFIYDPSTAENQLFDHDRFRGLVNQLVSHQLPVLRCRLDELPLSIDKPYWVEDEHFHTDHHIHHYALPSPASWDQLYRVCEDFHAVPLDRARPLWQALIIDGIDHLQGHPEGCVGVMMKIHHSVVDGNTAIRLFANLHTLSNEKDAPLIDNSMPMSQKDFTAPSVFEKYSMAYKHLILNPFALGKGVAKLAKTYIKTPELKESANVREVTQMRFNLAPEADRVIGHISLPKEQIQLIRNHTHCTINEIAMTVVAGGMRQYLKARSELPKVDLVAGMPIDIRPKNNEQKNKQNHGNHLSFANLSLHTTIAEPLERLKTIHQSSIAIKKRHQLLGPETIMSLVENLYPSILKWGGEKIVTTDLINLIPAINNTIVTNVPGIDAECYLCGSKLVDYLGFGPLPPILNLFHVVSSVSDHVNITFISCQSGIDNKTDYQKALTASFDELLAAVKQAQSCDKEA